ncbi:uncharacterized protein LOC131048675 isoform X2 [Cryptomeria japonica]|uniref:uncharacterized protein LOC131048675 isoform X2 n=1 Tax=Cryptomeria japonica TaxID=3369 RepID=UPI0027DA8FD5|nr:uncharacterized protein LOC131048675 isoform X2 [Cryptomeria japonica]
MPGGENKAENFYAVLGLKSDCRPSELRNAYKKLAMRWHPDRWSASGNAKLAEESKKKFQAIQEAYSGVYEDDDDDGMRDFLGEMMVMMNDSKAQTSGSESFEDLQGLFMEMFEADLNESHTKPSMTNNCGSKRNCFGSVRMEDMGNQSFMMGTGSSFTVQSFSVGTVIFWCSQKILILVARAKGGMEGDIDDDDDYNYLYLTLEMPREEDLTMWVVGRNNNCSRKIQTFHNHMIVPIGNRHFFSSNDLFFTGLGVCWLIASLKESILRLGRYLGRHFLMLPLH